MKSMADYVSMCKATLHKIFMIGTRKEDADQLGALEKRAIAMPRMKSRLRGSIDGCSGCVIHVMKNKCLCNGWYANAHAHA